MKEKIVIVNFDELPNNVGEKRGRDRLLTIYDGKKIIDYMCHKMRGHVDTVILCGYLPTAMWIEVGAYLSGQNNEMVKRVEYKLTNRPPTYLPTTSGDILV